MKDLKKLLAEKVKKTKEALEAKAQPKGFPVKRVKESR